MYHLADGKILEGKRGIVGSEWKGRGNKIVQEKGLTIDIKCKVDPKAQTVSWYEEENLLGRGQFCEYLRNNDMVAYILLCHKGDAVELNT